MSARPLLLLSRLRARDQDSRRTDLLAPEDTYVWVRGPPQMRNTALLNSVDHALDQRHFHTEFSVAILHITRRAPKDPNTMCHLATLANQAGRLLLAHTCLHVDHSLHATSGPFAFFPEFSDRFLPRDRASH